MPKCLQWLVDKLTFPAPPCSYSLTSHPELFFVRGSKFQVSHPGVPCMLYAIPQGAPVLLIHAHSNGCDIGDMRLALQSISDCLRVHVMSFEFPGYGLHLGSSSMDSIDQATKAVLDYVVNELKIDPAQVVWYGRSIGSGPATSIVHHITTELKQRPGGLVLQCGFASFPEVAEHLFGRVAKRLVGTLWPNEALLKEVDCPVLVIHGAKDTMIPIEQSKKLWAAVHNKELSLFHTATCGHNDFNLRLDTLRPLEEFLAKLFAAPSYPESNFRIQIPQSSHMHVHHIGPLRSRIPVYTFRRPELDDWICEVIEDSTAKRAARSDTATDTQAGMKVAQVGNAYASPCVAASSKSLSAAGREIIDAKGVDAKTASEAGCGAAMAPVVSNSKPKGNVKEKSKAGKQNVPPAFPDLSTPLGVDDVHAALVDVEGLVRSCASRLAAFLERLQVKLNRIEGLEQKPLAEVIAFVEGEFWASDPLICLWEEVQLPPFASEYHLPPAEQRVRFRLGAFSVNNRGVRRCDSEVGDVGADVLRVPLWVFCPSAAHFRCLAEWSLLTSERLACSLPGAAGSKRHCCCIPCTASKRSMGGPVASRSRSSSRSCSRVARPGETVGCPSRGVIATSLAVHFVNWVVEKNPDVYNIFQRFVELYNRPEEALKPQQAPQKPAAPSAAAPLLPCSPTDLNRPSTPEATCKEHTDPSLTSAGIHAPIPHETGMPSCEDVKKMPAGGSSRPPWKPDFFSERARLHLKGKAGPPSGLVADFYGRLWAPEESAAEDSSPRSGGPVAELLTVLPETWSIAELLRMPGSPTDWMAACMLGHYQRYFAGMDTASEFEHGWGDALQPAARQLSVSLNQSMTAFAQSESRARHAQELERIVALQKRLVQQPLGASENGSLSSSQFESGMFQAERPV